MRIMPDAFQLPHAIASRLDAWGPIMRSALELARAGFLREHRGHVRRQRGGGLSPPWSTTTIRVGTDCSGLDAPIWALRQLGIPHAHAFSCDCWHPARSIIAVNSACGAPLLQYDWPTIGCSPSARCLCMWVPLPAVQHIEQSFILLPCGKSEATEGIGTDSPRPVTCTCRPGERAWHHAEESRSAASSAAHACALLFPHHFGPPNVWHACAAPQGLHVGCALGCPGNGNFHSHD